MGVAEFGLENLVSPLVPGVQSPDATFGEQFAMEPLRLRQSLFVDVVHALAFSFLWFARLTLRVSLTGPFPPASPSSGSMWTGWSTG